MPEVPAEILIRPLIFVILLVCAIGELYLIHEYIHGIWGKKGHQDNDEQY